MISDSHFQIGTSHEICQDYALTGIVNRNMRFAIVSDGCTMSHDECGQVDLGARIVSYAAKNAIRNIIGNILKLEDNLVIANSMLKNEILAATKLIGENINLHPLFSDCTLLAAIVDMDKTAHVFMYGDGNVYVKLNNGEFIIIDITYLSGAPFYLSYNLDQCRKEAYIDQFGDNPVLIDRYRFRDDGEMIHKDSLQITTKDPEFYEKCMFSFSGVEYISLMSDGMKSFVKHEDNNFNPISYLDVILEFNNFKNKNGVLVQRRMKAVNKSHKLLEISHYDDVSLATVLV